LLRKPDFEGVFKMASNLIEVFEGNTVPVSVKVYTGTDEDATLDLTGYSATFIVKDKEDGTEYLNKNLTIADQNIYQGYASLELSSTEMTLAPGTYMYEINIFLTGSPENVYTVAQDMLIIKSRI
jgi:hypothetical protein